MNDLICADEVYAIQGAIFEVYKTLGSGYLEGVYQEALELELASRGILYKSQPEITISYKGTTLHQKYRADIICYDKIILELKAAKELLPEHSAQLFNYLRGANMRLGLLVNFNHYPGVDIRRIAL